MKINCQVVYGILSVFMFCNVLSGTEFFVGKNGNNKNSGTSRAQAYKTIKRAVKTMNPGDTLTILPGTYHESVEWRFSGGDKTTTIKADIPGSVLLRGDTDAPKFTRHSGSKRIWQCKQKNIPQAVNERDTLYIYSRLPSVAEMNFLPGTWFYDKKSKTLYVHTSDSEAPSKHYLTISDIRGHGILIHGGKSVRNISIEDIMVTGFNANSPGGRPGHNAKWGIYFVAPQNCTVRNVTAFLNGSGIGFTYPSSKSTIENCRAYANYSPFYGSGGNIIILTPAKNDAIRKCVSFGSRSAGIRYYGGKPAENSIFDDNISFDNGYGDLWVKYPSDTTVARRCISGKFLHSRRAENCIFDYGVTYYFGASQNCIIRPREKKYNPDREFADHLNHDYRLQSDSVFRGSGKGGIDRGPAPFSKLVYFVKNSGSNAKDGNSMRTAWKGLNYAAKKLTAGSTLYLAPGVYKESIVLKNLKNITIRGRGKVPPVIKGKIRLINCRNLTLERLNFVNNNAAIDISNSSGINIKQLGINGSLKITKCNNLQIKNCAFTKGKVILEACKNAVFCGNILGKNSILETKETKIWANFNSYVNNIPFKEKNSIIAVPQFSNAEAGVFTLKNADPFNGRNINAMPIGPYRRQPCGEPLKLDGPNLLSTTATTANIEFWSNIPITGELRYGNTKRCVKRIAFRKPSSFQTISLTGLTPGNKYYFKVKGRAKAASQYSNKELTPELKKYKRAYYSKVIKFTTSAKDAQAQTWHVAINGSNSNSGKSLQNAWRTISHAAATARAGDTILVHKGKYFETVRVRCTGDKNRVLTIRSALGEKVWIDGNIRQLEQGFSIYNKNYIKIDGFYFRDFLSRSSAITAGVALYNSNNIELTRCFYDGRSRGYSPHFVQAEKCSNLNINNCFLTRGFSGMSFVNCPGLMMRNSVIYINQVTSCKIYNKPTEKATLINNIWVDNTLQKVGNSLIVMRDGASLIERNNCYLLRVGQDEKTIFGYSRYNNKKLPSVFKGKVLDRQWKRQGRFATEMATYKDYLKRSGQKGTALFADPKMKALAKFIKFSSLEDWEKNFNKFKPAHNVDEYHYVKGKFQPLDFDDFFAKNPECIKRKIGLQPEAFKDFKF
jgi:Right handed beta helix region/Protein of unknown function (DUF1565)